MAAGAEAELHVKGFTGLQRAMKLVSKDASKELRTSLRAAADPVRSGAETKAVQEISHIGPRWSRMRVGVTTKVVYVAPKERGRASRRNRSIRRPNLAVLLMDKAMEPSLLEHIPEVERRVDAMLAGLGREWEQVPLG